MTVITDIHTHFCILRLEHRIPKIAWFKEKLFPEAGSVRYMILAILSEIATVGVEDLDSIVLAVRDEHPPVRGHADAVGQVELSRARPRFAPRLD